MISPRTNGGRERHALGFVLNGGVIGPQRKWGPRSGRPAAWKKQRNVKIQSFATFRIRTENGGDTSDHLRRTQRPNPAAAEHQQ
ncbi:hypothetical protein [Mycobacterium sp. NPDC050853]|uniref:hypothetical protein n=1 Tax=Mycobacterium sp. NPDC050853 TaxID=3155160 RepID=UPI0034033B60